MRHSKVITKSAVLPVNLYSVKEHLGIYHDEKNQNLTLLMQAAVNIAEKFTGQIFRCGGDVIDQYSNLFPEILELDYVPVTGVTSVKYFDSSNTEQTLSTGNFEVLNFTTPATVKFDSYLPSVYDRQDAVTVRYVCVYAKAADVPSDVKAAILLICQYLYDNPGDSVRQMPTASEYILRNYKVH
jgi:uncharacterized phiE125 gp8 family phage protein